MFRTNPDPFLARLGQVLVRPEPADGRYAPDASAVAFVRFATACPPVDRWRAAHRVRAGLVPVGAVVATFDMLGRYGCADGSAHAAIALAVTAPDPRGADWIAQVGYLEVLEQMRHPADESIVMMPAHARPAWLGPPRPPLPHAPLRRRRLPFLRGDLRRAGAGALLCDDADQYCVVALAHPVVD